MATNNEVGGAHAGLRNRNGNSDGGPDGTEEGDDCECRVEQCPQCQQEVVNQSMEDHLQEDHQEVPCELQYAGCDFKGDRYQITQHIESNMPRHLSLISEFTKKERDKCNRAISVIKYTVVVGVIVGVIIGVIVGAFILGGFVYLDRRLEGHVKLLNDSKVPSLKSRIKLLKNSLDKNASSLQRLRLDFKNVKLILCELGIDVEKLMNGFSKKYIDDTFRAFFKSPQTIPIA